VQFVDGGDQFLVVGVDHAAVYDQIISPFKIRHSNSRV